MDTDFSQIMLLTDGVVDMEAACDLVGSLKAIFLNIIIVFLGKEQFYHVQNAESQNPVVNSAKSQKSLSPIS